MRSILILIVKASESNIALIISAFDVFAFRPMNPDETVSLFKFGMSRIPNAGTK